MNINEFHSSCIYHYEANAGYAGKKHARPAEGGDAIGYLHECTGDGNPLLLTTCWEENGTEAAGQNSTRHV